MFSSGQRLRKLWWRAETESRVMAGDKNDGPSMTYSKFYN